MEKPTLSCELACSGACSTESEWRCAIGLAAAVGGGLTSIIGVSVMAS